MTSTSTEQLPGDNEELSRRLEEAEETLCAIRGGEVDAVLVVAGREQVFTLESPDRPYRLLVEQMPQGAATLSDDGVILYCNRHFAELLGRPAETLAGQPAHCFVRAADRPRLETFLERGRSGNTRERLALERADGTLVPVCLGVNALREGTARPCLVVTDLTDQQRHEALAAAEGLARSILEQAVDAIMVCDAAGQVVRASQGAQALCGQDPLHRPVEAVLPLYRSTPGAGDPTEPAPLVLAPVLGAGRPGGGSTCSCAVPTAAGARCCSAPDHCGTRQAGWRGRC
jgi:PAS domain S-box-containing protein